MNDAAPFEVTKQIRFHHCDLAGIVFYPQYFVLFNELVEDWFDEGLGIDFAALHQQRLGIPMAHIECDFVAPCKLGDRLRLRLSVARIGASSVTLAVEVRAGGDVRLRATLVLVYASLDTRKPLPLSEALRASLARFVGNPAP